jgi:hypothetical protein
MDYQTLAALAAIGVPAILGLGWLFKLHSEIAVMRERLNGEVELRRSLNSRLDGFEQQIYRKLETIIEKLDQKADKP